MLLIDLLEKCTVLDPNKRINAEDALKHPFVNPFNSMKKIWLIYMSYNLFSYKFMNLIQDFLYKF